MLRRTVFAVVVGVLLFSTLACNSLSSSGLPILILNPNVTSSSDAVPEVAMEEGLRDTLSPAAGRSVPVAAAAEEETPAVEEAMPTEEDTPTVRPTLVVRLETPTPAANALPTLPRVTPQPTAEPMQTATPTPIVIEVPTSAAPGPTAVAPTAQHAAQGTAPEVIWIDDQAGYPQSKLMGWRADTSYPLLDDETYVGPVLEFNASPGGEWLAYTTVDSPSIHQVNTTTGEQREIEPKYPWWCYRFPAWSPDGTLLAFVAGADSSPWASPPGAGLWVSSPDGADPKQVVKGVGWANQQVMLSGWHPSKMELIYALPNLPGTLLPQWLTMALDSETPQTLPLTGKLYDVSPDGTWLLGDGFTSNPPEGRQAYSFDALMRVPVDGTTAQVLTPACRSDIMGQISPGGTRIAFLSMPTIGLTCPPPSGPITYELWVMNADGSDRHQIPIEGVVGRNSPQWSPDSATLYYSAWNNSGSALWKADASGAVPAAELPQTEGADRFTVIR